MARSTVARIGSDGTLGPFEPTPQCRRHGAAAASDGRAVVL